MKGFLAPAEADALFEELISTTPWRQDTIRIAGRKIPVPRLQAWYGDAHSFYAYSGIALSPIPWTETLDRLRQALQQAAETTFNSALLNLYRDGSDSVSWHADDEPELGEEPVIASLSLGISRRFCFRPRNGGRQLCCDLDHGDLLIMGEGTQRNWLHAIPKEKQVLSPRINLTFRDVVKPRPT